MKITDMFSNIEVDLSAIGLMRDKLFPHYFCTPLDAVIFACLGVDGIHFCIIPDEDDLTLEYSPVYVVSPMMSNHYVEAIAENFYDFINLIVSVKDAGALECISYLETEKFSEYIQGISQNNLEAENALVAISNTFPTKIIDDVYIHVKHLQAKTDLTKIRYSEEYYEL